MVRQRSKVLAQKILVRDWRVVLVAPAEHFFPPVAQLNELISATVTRKISILLPDTQQARDWANAVELDVHFCLPADNDDKSRWSRALQFRACESELLVYLLGGTRAPHHWDARLVASHQRSGEDTVVSPLGVRHPFLSAFSDASHTPGLDVDDVDQWVNDYSVGRESSIPVVSPSCFLMPPSIRVSVSVSRDEELSTAIRAAGGETVLCTQLYLDDSEVVPEIVVQSLASAYREAFQYRSPLTPMRHALTELSARGEAPAQLLKCLPVQLHVGHSWGGGLARWMEDYTAADDLHHSLVLRSLGDLSAFGQSIGLFAGADTIRPIKTWVLMEPILSVHVGNLEYREILNEVIEDYGVESLVVSSLIGHSLDLLRTALPTTIVLHEFFPFCPALYATFESPCRSCDHVRLTECLQSNPRNDFFKHEESSHWIIVRNAFAQLLTESAFTVIAPDQSVVDRYIELEPRLAQRELHVVPHGLNAEFADALCAVRSIGPHAGRDRLQLVILGRLTQEKGGQLLEAMLPEVGKIADVFLLGTGESGAQFEGALGVQVVRSYDSRELPRLLADIQPDIGLLLSTVPETFSYTLSELWAAGIPVLATRLGAFATRINDGYTGWLVEPTADAVLSKLQTLQGDRQVINAIAAKLRETNPPSAAEMVARYTNILPLRDDTPLTRYHLPRRSYRSPYAEAAETASAPLLVNPQLSYRAVLSEFLLYSASKAEHSPKLRWRVGSFVARALRFLAQRAHP